MTYRVALVGNPNCGKTTLFNCLTGSNLYVGNWPGVTIEKKEGLMKGTGDEIILIDLPGIYSLAPYSMDEIVSRDFLINEAPDLIINIIDASNIERNLYLTTQLMEMGIPMIGALNMMDVLERKGILIDCEALSKAFGFPFIQISAQQELGIQELIALTDANLGRTQGKWTYPRVFPSKIQDVFDAFGKKIEGQYSDILPNYPGIFRSIKLIEQDEVLAKQEQHDIVRLDAEISEARREIREISGQDVDGAIADYRYRFITAGVEGARRQDGKDTLAIEDRIDKVLMNRFAALPIFFVFMFIIYFISINVVGNLTSSWIDGFIADGLIPWVSTVLSAIGTAQWLIALITNGAITGVGAVLTFIPQITVLFIFISVLEDSGYMARVAFMMDRAFRRFGLSGKSFIPMVVGLGCSVPAIMATRTLENERDRKLTIILTPFISCGAKMPLYVLLASAFFAEQQSIMVFSLYLVSLLVVFLSGILLSKTKFRGASSDYLLELPPYRVPSLKNTMSQVWLRVKEFIVRAGTIIFLASVVLWFLQAFGTNFQMTADPDSSILAAFGKIIAPAFIPLGFGNWVASVSLLSGIAAKEMIISTMSVLLSGVDGGFTMALSQIFTPLSAYAYILFVLLCSPCIAALATMKRELGSWRDFLFAIVYQVGTAYLVSMAVFQIGSFFF
ncbi:ferrous iron transport protein B [Eubacterium sp.]|uniref:ferrous iron transport protein B n=1 Tax=Eubacterium sp. TaxID=142586 RepID=UPI002FC90D27